MRDEPGRPLTDELRAVLWLFALLALTAGVMLFVFSNRADDFFSWKVAPPLTAAFLGASYWAACILLAWTAQRRSWLRARATMLPVITIAVLLLVATLIHEDRFDFGRVFGLFWLVAYIVVPPVLGLALWRQLRVRGSDETLRVPIPGWLRVLVGLQALVMLGVGIALFVAPADAKDIWAWPLTPLNARVVGAFVIGFGVSAANAAWEHDLYRFEGSALAYAALGVLELAALAWHEPDLAGGSTDTWLYVAFLVSVVIAGAAATVQARRLGTRHQGLPGYSGSTLAA
jgi:membrane protein CcdC involved in cytochrome C biogenesis